MSGLYDFWPEVTSGPGQSGPESNLEGEQSCLR
jgi:hypothetical protein